MVEVTEKQLLMARRAAGWRRPPADTAAHRTWYALDRGAALEVLRPEAVAELVEHYQRQGVEFLDGGRIIVPEAWAR